MHGDLGSSRFGFRVKYIQAEERYSRHWQVDPLESFVEVTE